MPSSSRILVTGATGKVGQVFIQHLLADPNYAHFTVRALCHNRLLPASDRLEVVRGAIEDRAVVQEIMRDVTHVLHLATSKETPETMGSSNNLLRSNLIQRKGEVYKTEWLKVIH